MPALLCEAVMCNALSYVSIPCDAMQCRWIETTRKSHCFQWPMRVALRRGAARSPALQFLAFHQGLKRPGKRCDPLTALLYVERLCDTVRLLAFRCNTVPCVPVRCTLLFRSQNNLVEVALASPRVSRAAGVSPCGFQLRAFPMPLAHAPST